LGSTLSFLFAHPEETERMAAAGQATAQQRFSLDAMTESISILLSRIVHEQA
jgi:hypothetical protein